MSWTGNEAYLAAGTTFVNYLMTQLGAWMQVRAEREVYENQVKAMQSLERHGVFARLLHVRGEPGKPVRIGRSYEDGWPQAVDQFAWLSSEPIELVDEAGRSWTLQPGVSLYVGYVEGTRERFEVDNAGELFDFCIKAEQSFYMLMTEAGIYPIPRGSPFGTPYYHVTTRVADFERQVKPRGAFGAWIVLPLMAALFLASHYYFFPDDREAKIGLIMLSFGMWLFVCLSEVIFAAPFPRHKTALPVRRWKPELR